MLFSAADVAEEALREIGVLTPYDTAAQPDEFRIALRRLVLLLDEWVGTNKFWFFVPSNVEIPLTVDKTEYALNAFTGDPLQFIHEAYLLKDGKEVGRVTLLRRSEYNDLVDDVNTDGLPGVAYIERKDQPTLSFPTGVKVAGLTLRVTGMKYANNILTKNGEVAHGFPAAWQRALTLGLAVDIGDGPVTTIPEGELDRKQKKFMVAWSNLMSFNNREQVRRPRFTRMRDF